MDEQFKQQGAFSRCDLMTTAAGAAKTFYTKLFGGETEEMPMPGMPPMWEAYVTVDDVDATAKIAEQLGGKLPVLPQDIPEVGRLQEFTDFPADVQKAASGFRGMLAKGA